MGLRASGLEHHVISQADQRGIREGPGQSSLVKADAVLTPS